MIQKYNNPKKDDFKFICIEDFRTFAKARLPHAIFVYIDSGAQNCITRKENSSAFQKILIIPRILVSSSNTDLSTEIFGHKLALPIGFSPTLNHTLSHKDGELISSFVAGRRNICYTQSIYGGKSLQQIDSQNDLGYRKYSQQIKQTSKNDKGMRLFQIYVSNQWQKTIKTIKLAEKHGFTGLVITVDTQVIGVRHGQQQNYFDISKFQFPILDQIAETSGNQRDAYRKSRDLKMNWQTIKRIKGLTSMKIILKGILSPQDAKIALITQSCDAIWVSNHGGRQLDTVMPTIEALPGIKAVIGNKLPIFVDGGIRGGSDIFKCLALGADCVFLGRAVFYSLVSGQKGVQRLVDILYEELNRTMVLSGVKNIGQINAKFLKHSAHL